MMCFFLYQYNISLPILSGVTILSSERDDETLCESAGCSDVIERILLPCSTCSTGLQRTTWCIGAHHFLPAILAIVITRHDDEYESKADAEFDLAESINPITKGVLSRSTLHVR